MRRAESHLRCAGTPRCPCRRRGRQAPRSDCETLRKLLPYLWQYRWRVVLALAFLVAAKLANVGVPLLLKHLVDALALKPGDPRAVLVVPVGLLVGYGALRLSTSLFTELRELLFCQVTARTPRAASRSRCSRHLHALSLRFHLERQTGGMSRDIERGTRVDPVAVSYYTLQHPADAGRDQLVLLLLSAKFDAWFAGSRSSRWCSTSRSPSR